MSPPDAAGERRPAATQGAIRETGRATRLASGLNVALAGPRDLDPELIGEWERLEARSVEDNAFLSPSFVLPALEHLAPPGDLLFASVHLPEDGASSLIGMAVFEKRPPSWRIPFPHLRAFRTPHTFLSGVLADRTFRAPACDALFERLAAAGWSVIEFVDRSAAGELTSQLDDSARRVGMRWFETERTERATLVPTEILPAYLERMSTSKRGAGLLKNIKKLSAVAPVTYHVRRGDGGESLARPTDTFLALERMGWKGTAGTALACRPETEAFFRKVVREFSRVGACAFAELSLGEHVVASSSLFISGRTGFSFKVGWDPQYAKQALGMVLELKFVLHSPEHFGALECIDGCAEGPSYLDGIWPGRRPIASGCYASGLAGAHARVMARLRLLKRRVAARVRAGGEPAPARNRLTGGR
jgi:hypothetical protein